MAQTCFQAGFDGPQTFAVRMNLFRAGFNESRATMLARWVEFWCQKNAFARWHVAQTTDQLVVSFESDIDVVLFLISEEYSYFVPAATTRPKAEEALPPAFVVAEFSARRAPARRRTSGPVPGSYRRPRSCAPTRAGR